MVQQLDRPYCTHNYAGEEERERFVTELESFIAQLLKMVEVELNFNFETLNKISGQIHGEAVQHNAQYTRTCTCTAVAALLPKERFVIVSL